MVNRIVVNKVEILVEDDDVKVSFLLSSFNRLQAYYELMLRDAERFVYLFNESDEGGFADNAYPAAYEIGVLYPRKMGDRPVATAIGSRAKIYLSTYETADLVNQIEQAIVQHRAESQ